MDKIHNLDKKSWIHPTNCNLRELLEKRSLQLEKNNVTLTAKRSSEHEESFARLSQQLETFVRDGEKQIKPYFIFNSTDERFLVDNPNCELEMYKLQLEHAKRMISDRAYKVNHLTKNLRTTRKELLMRQLALMNREPTSSTAETRPSSVTDESTSEKIDAIAVVQIWPQPKRHAKIGLKREILFRSGQPLTDLRDQFKCQRDHGVPMDLSEYPEQQSERVSRGELFKSGFFLIEDTFYNDLRDPNNIDLSKSIVQWASEDVKAIDKEGRNTTTSRGIGPFKQAQMECFTFNDINFRLGYPYLYLHQGNCEHLFTISDIRYISAGDSAVEREKYPFVTATAIGRKEDALKCYMCRSRPPHWYTRKNSRLPVDPFFFCDSCFHSFNYDSERKKIGNFQAYVYAGSLGIPESISSSAEPNR